jgi:hypothetical protein
MTFTDFTVIYIYIVVSGRSKEKDISIIKKYIFGLVETNTVRFGDREIQYSLIDYCKHN